MKTNKNIALVAHDNLKPDLLEWAKTNREELSKHQLYATGTTGHLLKETLKLDIHCFNSGPLGGDQQLGAKITEGGIDVIFFFIDPLSAHSHDVDVKALIRIAVVHDIAIAINQASADFMINSRWMSKEYNNRPLSFEMNGNLD